MNKISFKQFALLYSLQYAIFTPYLILKLTQIKALNYSFNLSKLTKRIMPYMLRFAGLYWAQGLFSISAMFIDTIAIAGLQGLNYTAYYIIATYFITLMVLPQRH